MALIMLIMIDHILMGWWSFVVANGGKTGTQWSVHSSWMAGSVCPDKIQSQCGYI